MPCKDMTGRDHCCRKGGAGSLALPSGVDAHTIREWMGKFAGEPELALAGEGAVQAELLAAARGGHGADNGHRLGMALSFKPADNVAIVGVCIHNLLKFTGKCCRHGF